jgi:dephospho-CoA kinase
MRIIQISGKGRVGKTTLANLIAKHSFELGYNPVIIPFALVIKEMAEAKGLTKESDSTKYREFCQNLGATKRIEDENYWVTRTYEKIQEYMIKEIDNKKAGKTHYEYVIIQDDVRYMNELALGRDLVATQIFIDSGIRELSENNAEWRQHESEVLANLVEESFGSPNSEYEELFDVIIQNDGTPVELEKEVKENIKEWLDLGYIELEAYDEAE